MADILRASIIVDDMTQVMGANAAILRAFVPDSKLEDTTKDGDVYRNSRVSLVIADRFKTPTPAGYSDVQIKVEIAPGMFAELQVHIPEMLIAKEGWFPGIPEQYRAEILGVPNGLGHKLFEEYRTYSKESKAPRKLELEREMGELYALAIRASNARFAAKNSSQVNGPRVPAASGIGARSGPPNRNAPLGPSPNTPSPSTATGTPSSIQNSAVAEKGFTGAVTIEDGQKSKNSQAESASIAITSKNISDYAGAVNVTERIAEKDNLKGAFEIPARSSSGASSDSGDVNSEGSRGDRNPGSGRSEAGQQTGQALSSSPSQEYLRLTKGDQGNDPITPNTEQVAWAERNPESAKKLRRAADEQAVKNGYHPDEYLHGTLGNSPEMSVDSPAYQKDNVRTYDGTGPNDWDVFSKEKTSRQMGLHFFTKNRVWAEFFTKLEETNGKNPGGYRFIPAYLKFSKAWDINNPAHIELVKPILSEVQRSMVSGNYGWTAIEQPHVIEFLKSQGFDAIKLKERDPEGWFDDFDTLAVFEPNQIKTASLVTFDKAGNIIPPAQRFDETNDSILYSSPSPGLDLFGDIDMQILGPRAKAKANAVAAAKSQPSNSPGRAQIAKRIAKNEGLADLDLFAAAAQKSLDAKPKRTQRAANANNDGQLGFAFGADLPSRQQTGGTDRSLRIGQTGELPSGDSNRSSGNGAINDVGSPLGDLAGGSRNDGATDNADGRGGRSDARGRAGSNEDRKPRREDAGRRSLTERERPPLDSPDRNFRIGKDTVLAEGGAVTRIRNNIAAIDLIRTLENEDRNPTTAEKQVLAKFVGWGGLPQVFDEKKARDIERGEIETRQQTAKKYSTWGPQYANLVADMMKQASDLDAWRTKWMDHYQRLRELLTPDEWQSARDSTINAHYTSPTVIGSMWDAIQRFGFQGGNILEPAGGVGHKSPGSVRAS